MSAATRGSRRTSRASSRARTASGRGSSPRRRRSTRSGTRSTRRRTPTLPTTLGAALGALVVTVLLDASWPVRIGVVALVVVVGLFVLSRRGRAAGSPDPALPSLPSHPAGQQGHADDRPSPAAYGPNSVDTQGDSTDD